jgi:hypothetical protein
VYQCTDWIFKRQEEGDFSDADKKKSVSKISVPDRKGIIQMWVYKF